MICITEGLLLHRCVRVGSAIGTVGAELTWQLEQSQQRDARQLRPPSCICEEMEELHVPLLLGRRWLVPGGGGSGGGGIGGEGGGARQRERHWGSARGERGGQDEHGQWSGGGRHRGSASRLCVRRGGFLVCQHYRTEV